MRSFGYEFELIDDEHMEELLSLERESAIYTDLWREYLQDFRHVRIVLTDAEIQEYVRSLWAYELFLRADCPDLASSIPEIPRDIAERADAYTCVFEDGTEVHPWHCVAGFMGPELERILCFFVESRQEIVAELGTAALLTTLRRAIDSITPAIRRFNHREKRLSEWAISCEDDVRDLLYVILRASIDDIKTEESIPSRAGTHKFVDIFSGLARLFVEVKWISEHGKWRQIVKQINDDIQSYIMHPACKTLAFIVMDAAKDIPDPAQFERDLSGRQTINDKEIDVLVFVREP